MTDYKLVSMELLRSWHERINTIAVETAFGVADEMEAILESAPQPAVQGEPVGFCEDTALSLAERTFSTEVGEHLAEDVIQYARRLHDLYATPQPTEHHPLSHDWDDQDKCRRCGDRDWYAAATCTPKQQTEPDAPGLVEAMRQYRHNDGSGVVFGYDLEITQRVVAGLVEVLEELTDLMEDTRQGEYTPDSFTTQPARIVLATHRKGGDV